MKVSIGIKALNEERHIGACVASAVAAVAPYGGEVILADSGSTDRTIAIASEYPIQIVQFANLAERGCGAGAQLAFQHAQGEFFYLLDGDMVLDAGFIADALAYLDAHPDVAAVGGLVEEKNLQSEEFQVRVKAAAEDHDGRFGLVDRLDGGGLYRAAAVREAGWFGDRNLHAFEEFDLGARLQARGWKLARVTRHAVDHHGHTMSGYRLMMRRMLTGYSGGAGEVLRAAIGRPHLPIVLRNLNHIRHAVVVIAWWLLLVAAAASAAWIGWGALLLMAALFAVPLGFLTWRRGSLGLGLYSLAGWNVSAVGLITGLFHRRVRPDQPIASRDLSPSRPAARG